MRGASQSFATLILLALALCATGPAISQTQVREPVALHDQAMVEHVAALRVMETVGMRAGAPYVRKAAATTRGWLVASGQMTLDRDQRLREIEQICAPGRYCTDYIAYNAWLNLKLLLELHLSATPSYRATEAYLAGRRVYDDNDRDALTAARDAEPLYARGAEILVAKALISPLTALDVSMLKSLLGQAAQMAYEAGDCRRTVRHAESLLAVSQRYPEHGGYLSAATTVFALEGSCALWSREPAEALEFARRAIAAEDGPYIVTGSQHGLDLQSRYLTAPPPRADPREVGVIAALLLWQQAEPSERARLLADIVRWSGEARRSMLSDAVLIALQARDGTPPVQAAIAALLAANHAEEAARRDFDSGVPGAQARLGTTTAALERAEAAATAAGVTLPAPSATLEEIRAALAPGQGFLFLYPTQFGPLIWGVAASGEAFLVPPDERMLARFGRVPPGQPREEAIALTPPAKYFQHKYIGLDMRLRNAWLSLDPRAQDGEELLARVLLRLGTDFGPPLLTLRGRADYWAIAHSNELDGAPLAQIPLLTRDEIRSAEEEAASGRLALDRFGIDRMLGYDMAYAIVPTPRAFVALGNQRKARHDPVSAGYLGIGDIPFAGMPCGRAQSGLPATGDIATPARRRAAILAMPCIAESRAQLSAFEGIGGQSRLLTGRAASEAGLAKFRGQAIGILAVSTHGLPPGSALGGGAPVLLLYPPPGRGGDDDDGMLTPIEAAQLGIRAELVILSACYTGAEDQNRGEEPLAGMARGFFLGGARSVLITRWELNATMAQAANRAFAEALRRGKSRAVALRSARRALLASFPRVRPWQWAVLELIGDGATL